MLEPQLRVKIDASRVAVDGALEGLGLHGLVNRSQDDRLVDVIDAARCELIDHRERLKLINVKFVHLVHENKLSLKDKTHKMTGFIQDYSLKEQSGPLPTQSSHQRLMKVRLSEVEERWKRNASALELLQATLSNEAIESLIKVLKRRVKIDKEVVSQHRILSQSTKIKRRGVASSTENPVIFEFLLAYSRAFSKILDMAPEASSVLEDSGLCEDRSSDCHTGSAVDITSNGIQHISSKSHSRSASSDQANITGSSSTGSNDLAPHKRRGAPRHRSSDDAIAESSWRGVDMETSCTNYETPGSSQTSGCFSTSHEPRPRTKPRPYWTAPDGSRRKVISQPEMSHEGFIPQEYSHGSRSPGRGLDYPPSDGPMPPLWYYPGMPPHQPGMMPGSGSMQGLDQFTVYKDAEIAFLRRELDKMGIDLTSTRRKLAEMSRRNWAEQRDSRHHDNRRSRYYDSRKSSDHSQHRSTSSHMRSSSAVNSGSAMPSVKSLSFGSLAPERTPRSFESKGVQGQIHRQANRRSANYSQNLTKFDLVERYGLLYTSRRADAARALDDLPELRGSEELQQKILFSVMILSFRCVQQTVDSAKSKVWKTIDAVMGSSREDENDRKAGGCMQDAADGVDWSVLAYLFQKHSAAKFQHNADRVKAQLWTTLYDFPSIKQCSRFNGFIAACVEICWHILTSPPGYALEYDCHTFSARRHVRCPNASQGSTRIIKFIWPSLIETTGSKPSIYRGIVLT